MEEKDKKPVLIVIAGPNGSGKTSVTTKILHHEWMEDAVYINPDLVAQERFGDWNSPEAIRKAVKKGELKTMAEIRNYDGGLKDNFKITEQSIKDPILHEEFMQAYFSYINLNDQLYDSLALILPEN